jgi:hypothetical protein
MSCILVPMIKIGDDPVISSGVIALFVFSVLAPLVAKPRIKTQDWTETWPVSVSYSYLVGHMYKDSGQ